MTKEQKNTKPTTLDISVKATAVTSTLKTQGMMYDKS